MALVHKRVFSDGSMIEIVTGPDDICAACPRLDGERCKSDDSSGVEARDDKVINRLGLAPGSRAQSDNIYRLVAGAFQSEDIPNLCKRCSWLELGCCAEGLRQIQSKVEISK